MTHTEECTHKHTDTHTLVSFLNYTVRLPTQAPNRNYFHCIKHSLPVDTLTTFDYTSMNIANAAGK